MKNITIIGGGACGVAVFIELLLQIISQKLTREVRITLIEKEEKVGYGLAFGTHQPGHLLNTQAELMGIHAEEPGHFADWLKKSGGKNRGDVKGKGPTGHAYTTRKLYGDYVAEQALFYLSKAKEKGVELELLHAEAVAVNRTGNFYEVVCHEGSRVRSSFIVLALGTPKPNNYSALRQHPQYIDFPWPSKRIIQRIKTRDHVGVLGSSLSAIDTIMTLVDNGHSGKITLFSPDGMLPRVQPEQTTPLKRKYLTRENIHKLKRQHFRDPGIQQLFRLFQQDVEDHSAHKPDWKAADRTGKPAKPFLEWDIACAEKGGDAILNVVYSLRYDASPMWSSLSMGEKKRFKKWFGAHWMINRHAMPLYNAYRLKALFKEKKLQVLPGLVEVDFDGQSKHFIIKRENSQTHQVDKLINSTGSSSELEKMECPLIEDLLKKGYLSAHPVGGTWINEKTMQTISPNGGEGIYALGHIVNGMLLDVNAVWYNVRTAATLIQDILFKIKQGSYP